MTNNDEKKKYEIMIVLQPDISEEEMAKKLEQVKKLIEKNKGEIFHEDIWGRKEFAYPIKKHTVGFFYVLNFISQEAKRIKEIEENLQLDNQVLRHLLIKTPFNYEIKSYKEEEIKEAEDKKKEVKVEEKKPIAKKKKPEKKTITPKIKPKTPKAEEKPEEKEEKKLESLDELDEKLKSIIENPDITL